MKKYELEALLSHIVDIVDGISYPYEEMDMSLNRIRDLAAQAVGKKERLGGAFLMPRFSKKTGK